MGWQCRSNGTDREKGKMRNGKEKWGKRNGKEKLGKKNRKEKWEIWKQNEKREISEKSENVQASKKKIQEQEKLETSVMTIGKKFLDKGIVVYIHTIAT